MISVGDKPFILTKGALALPSCPQVQDILIPLHTCLLGKRNRQALWLFENEFFFSFEVFS